MFVSVQILPDVKLTIVHPDTKIPCAHTDLGEVSVCGCVVTCDQLRISGRRDNVV